MQQHGADADHCTGCANDGARADNRGGDADHGGNSRDADYGRCGVADRGGCCGSPTAAATAAAMGSPTAAAGTPAAGTPTATPAPQGAAQPQSGGTAPTPRNETVILDQSLFNVFDSFNPFIPNGQQYQAGFQQTCKEFLFYANFAAGKVEPWLATGWKYNTDFTELTLTLDKNAKWNDGQPVTSKDLKFSIDMLKKNATLLTGGTIRQFVTDTSTPDAQTCLVKLNASNPRFHYQFICGIVGGFEMVPEHVWGNIDPTTFRDNPPVRSGPYKLKQVIPAQFMFVWEKNPDYWNKAKLDPKPKYVVYRSAPVMDSDANEFKRAQTDEGSLDYPHMQSIQASGYKNMVVETAFRDPCPRGMWINSDPSKGILSEAKFRWVLSYLLDREQIGTTVWLIKTPPAQYPWADYKSNSRWENAEIANSNKLTYDPAKAASLLDEIGAKKGSDGNRTYKGQPINIEIMTPALVGNPEYVIGQMVADELKKIGIPNVTVRYYQNPVWTQKSNTGDFDISSHWLCGVAFDPEPALQHLRDAVVRPDRSNGSQRQPGPDQGREPQQVRDSAGYHGPDLGGGQAGDGPGAECLLRGASGHTDHPDDLPSGVQHDLLDRVAN